MEKDLWQKETCILRKRAIQSSPLVETSSTVMTESPHKHSDGRRGKTGSELQCRGAVGVGQPIPNTTPLVSKHQTMTADTRDVAEILWARRTLARPQLFIAEFTYRWYKIDT